MLVKHLSHFNVHALGEPRMAARWSNALQRLAAQTPHGIPVTISTDPRHGFVQNEGVSFAAGSFSQWPEPLGLAALRDPETVRRFADIARQEYVAVGIRAALHPTLDLATEPRWARQAGTFGHDPAVVAELGSPTWRVCSDARWGRTAWPAPPSTSPVAGRNTTARTPTSPTVASRSIPADRFEDHLEPFLACHLGRHLGDDALLLDADRSEHRRRGHRGGRLRIQPPGRQRSAPRPLGYEGVVLTDWELICDNHVGDQVLPARAWGVEHLDVADRMAMILDAGADQFGGEENVDVLLDLVQSGRVSIERVDESARRLLTVKFQLGLFDDPFVDEDRLRSWSVGATSSRRVTVRRPPRSRCCTTTLRSLPLRSGTRLRRGSVDTGV